MTSDEVKNMLRIRYDITLIVAEKFTVIRNCQDKRYINLFFT